MFETLKGRRVAGITLGCKVNQYETDSMLELLKNAGCSVVSFEEEADIYIVNTCSVTAEAARKSRQSGESLLRSDGAADILVGNNRKADICSICEKAIKGELEHGAGVLTDISKEPEYEQLSVSAPMEKTRAYVKVQDGCNSFSCSRR